GTPHPILGAPCLKCHFGAVDPLPFFDNGSGNNNRLECATCHDVHNSYGLESLLRKTKAGSVICLECHNK
ncbi:MAG: hypothetical protein GY849_05270, partial [Deltaproteobacteria bacterium]|nr:hypothetical protein [Deltaproteobacteria bacterium]